MLVTPKSHRPLAFALYNQRRLMAKRIFYVAVSLLCSYLLISETSIVYFILAAFAIGAIWDLYNTFFQYPAASEVEELIKDGKPIPIYLYPSSSRNYIQGLAIIALVVWMYVDVFVSR